MRTVLASATGCLPTVLVAYAYVAKRRSTSDRENRYPPKGGPHAVELGKKGARVARQAGMAGLLV